MAVVYRVPRVYDGGVARPYRAGDIDADPAGVTYNYDERSGTVTVTVPDAVDAYEDDDDVVVVERVETDDSDGSDDEGVVMESGYTCGECGDTFDSSAALAGHKSSHSR